MDATEALLDELCDEIDGLQPHAFGDPDAAVDMVAALRERAEILESLVDQAEAVGLPKLASIGWDLACAYDRQHATQVEAALPVIRQRAQRAQGRTVEPGRELLAR